MAGPAPDNAPSRLEERYTNSGIPLRPVYSPRDVEGIDYQEEIGDPGTGQLGGDRGQAGNQRGRLDGGNGHGPQFIPGLTRCPRPNP